MADDVLVAKAFREDGVTLRLAAHLAGERGVPLGRLVRRAGPGAVWLHPDLLVSLCQTLSPRFGAWVCGLVREVLRAGHAAADRGQALAMLAGEFGAATAAALAGPDPEAS
jgi:hypothetical protein